MHSNARLLIIEAVLDRPNASIINHLFDLHMMVTTNGGRERYESEFNDVLDKAGFKMIMTIETCCSFCIMEAKKN